MSDVIDSFDLGNAPTARRLPRAHLKRPSIIWGLTPADPWRLRQARRHFIETSADDFVKEGRGGVDDPVITSYANFGHALGDLVRRAATGEWRSVHLLSVLRRSPTASQGFHDFRSSIASAPGSSRSVTLYPRFPCCEW